MVVLKEEGSVRITLLILCIFIIILFLSCSGGPKKSDVKELEMVEIKEYEGAKLGSITDFRENSIKGPQFIEEEKYRLLIDGLVKKKQEYTYREVIDSFTNYKKIVTIDCVEGWSVTILWEGMLIKDLLKVVEPESTAKVLIFHAYDGYTTSFPIEYLLENDIIMAHKMNGITIPPERGFPFHLVAEAKWGYKWIRWITRIELSDDIDYKGYWEQRGYNQDGDITGPVFEK